jgi:hypothetical protein
MGYKRRDEFFQSEIWQNMKDDVQQHKDVGHIYRVVPKCEWSDINDWKEDKTRTYLVPGAHVLFQQLKCYGRGTEAIKNYSWSKYGFNPFNGNVHRIAVRMLITDDDGKSVFPVRIYWDVRGYDRFIFLHHVAERRYRFFMNNVRNHPHAPFARWVSDGLIESVLILSNGDVVIRFRGNNSGSGMTTANNIEAGMEVVADLLIYAFYTRNGHYPSFEEVFEQLVMLYGDDNASALMEPFEAMLDKELIANRLLYYHGLQLKLLGGGKETPLGELSFLGFSFHNRGDGYYMPKWNLDRLLVPLVYTDKTPSLSVFLQRFYSIVMLSFAHDEWDSIRMAYLRVLTWAQTHSGDPQIKALVRLGAPTREALTIFYLGLESRLEAGGGWPKKIDTMSTVNNSEPLPWDGEPGNDYSRVVNYKGRLLDMAAQQRLGTPEFITHQIGTSNMPTFLGNLIFGGFNYTSVASTKKEAEQILAYKFLRRATAESLHPRSDTYKEAATSAVRPQFTDNSEYYDPNYYMDMLVGKIEQCSTTGKPVTKVEQQRVPLTTTKPEIKMTSKPTEVKLAERTGYEHGSAEQQMVFWIQLSQGVRAFANLSDEMKPYHPLWDVFGPHLTFNDDRAVAARLATMFKQGSFNPYGNGQTSSGQQYVLTEPTYKQIGMTHTAISQCLLPSGVLVTGTGNTKQAAFLDWKTQIDGYIDQWAPPTDGQWREVFGLLRSLPQPKNKTPYDYVWTDPEDIAMNRFARKWLEGKPYGNEQIVTHECADDFIQTFFEGFNPYGNGQPPPMKKSDWIAMNKERLKGKTTTQIESMYDDYVRKKQKEAKRGAKPRGAGRPQQGSQATVKTLGGGKYRGPNRPNGLEQRAQIKLSGCARLYAAALFCPFYIIDQASQGRVASLKIEAKENPCIPMFPALMTRKFYAFARGTGGILNAGDVFYIAFAPMRLGNNAPGNTNADYAVLFNNATAAFAAEAFPTMDTGAAYGALGSSTLNTDYSLADLLLVNNVGIEGRVVAAGLRFRYVGSDYLKAGLCVGVTEPNHQSLSGITNVEAGKMESYYTCTVHDISKKKNDEWFQINYSPVLPEEFDFRGDPIANGTYATTQGYDNHFMGALVTGLPIGQNIEWEAITHFEAVGAKVRGKSKGDADIVGTMVVNNAITPDSQKLAAMTNIPVKQIIKDEQSDITATALKEVPKMMEVVKDVGSLML